MNMTSQFINQLRSSRIRSQPMCTVQLKSAKLVLLNSCATWACITTFILKQELCVINFHVEGSTQRHATPLNLEIDHQILCTILCPHRDAALVRTSECLLSLSLSWFRPQPGPVCIPSALRRLKATS